MVAASLPLGSSEVGAGRYQLGRLLGEGSRKRVYVARDTRLDRDVALALIKPDLLDSTGLARVHRETQTMARLGDHPHIVTVHDIGDEHGQPYIVTQLMAGGSLEDLLGVEEGSPSRGLELNLVLRFGDHICRALEHAHAHGVIHRDLKPANVWLTADGTAKLGDFGLALERERSRMTVEGMMVGTVAYMAPEQALGRAVDVRADLYSLGALLYELVTGRPPFVGDDAILVISQHLHTQPVAPTWHNPAVPPPLDALILQLLEKDPAKRPLAATAVREILERLRSDDPASTTGAPAPAHAAAPELASSPAAANQLDRLDAGVFVGRSKELATLRAAVEDALSGRGRVVLIAGEAGIGKTRMAQELATYAQLRGMQVLWGRCHEGGGAPAYWPWVQAIRTYAHDRSPQQLRDELGSGAPEIGNIVSAVRERLPDLPQPTRLEPEQERFRLFDGVTMFLKRAAAHQPLLLVLDDLHWADAPSLLLLQFLVRAMESERLVVVGTHRDDETAPGEPVFASLVQLARAPVSRPMVLAGLGEPEIAELIERTAGEPASNGLLTVVARQTEGNPFFIGEVVRWLVSHGHWGKESGVFTGVPPSVRDVVGRRLQRLSPSCNELLTGGAVVGREFSLDLLARVLDQREDMLSEAEEAVAARVLTELEPGHYSFVHAIVRETLYAEAGTTRRRRLHRQVGEAIESFYAARLQQHLPALAYHFHEAASRDTAEKALDYAQRAADRAMAQTAYEAAVGYYERVLHALDRTEHPDQLRRAEVLLALGRAELGCGRRLEEARMRYLEVAAIAREIGAPELLARAALDFAAGPMLGLAIDAPRSQLLEEASAAIAEQGTTTQARVLARLAHDRAERARPPEEIAALCDEAIAIARRHGDAATTAHVLASAIRAQWQPQGLQRRIEWLRELTALSNEFDDKLLDIEVQYHHVVLSTQLGDRTGRDRALDLYTTIVNELRLPYFVHKAHLMRAASATISGRFAEAEHCTQDGLASFRSVYANFAYMLFHTQVWTVRREQGRGLEELQSGFTSMIERFPHATVRAALALHFTDLGDRDSARREFDRIATHEFTDIPKHPLTWQATIAMLAETCAILDDVRRAPVLYQLLEPSAEVSILNGDAACLGATSRYLGLLAATMRRWDDASRHFNHALAFNAALGAPPLAARTQCDYAATLLRCDAPGDRSRAVELLTAAVETAQQLGMKLVLERALTLKLQAQGGDSLDVKSSIDVVAADVNAARPDLRAHAAPDGTVTFFFSDIEGFTAMTERLGDARAHAVLSGHNRIIREQLARHGGFEVKSSGDGFMVTFQSARRAVLCAIAVQRALTGYAAEHPEEPIRVRIGLHTGEAINDAGDFYGTAVNVAARIAGAARGGEILVSSVLREITRGASEIRYGASRAVALKGVSSVRTVFAVAWGGEPEDTAPELDAAPPHTAILRHEGAYWTLSYGGSTGRLKDTRGLHYLAQLLRHPGREFHVVDLAQGIVGEPRVSDQAAAAAGGAGLEVLDPAAKAAYRHRLGELRDELADAERCNDIGRSERAREEVEAITAQLAAAVGLGGRDRTAASAAERARSTVSKRIKDAVKQIATIHPPLADHMSRRVKTGVFCSYLPDNAIPIDWNLS